METSQEILAKFSENSWKILEDSWKILGKFLENSRNVQKIVERKLLRKFLENSQKILRKFLDHSRTFLENP